MRYARALRLSLGRAPLGRLDGETDGRHSVAFDDPYIERGQARPTLSLSMIVPNTEDATRERLAAGLFSRVWLPSFFSNLLPEGGRREALAMQLGVAVDDELSLLAALGHDLPGAIVAKELSSTTLDDSSAHSESASLPAIEGGFSLAGAQLKFSMIAHGTRMTLPHADELGDSIVKPPSPAHPDLPLNEFAMMTLARAAGVDIPAIRLIEVDQLEGISLPVTKERWAYAIARYDRTPQARIHAEDFAQVLDLRPTEKYGNTNYDTMARVVLGLFPNAVQQVEELLRRLVVNVLVANADAHVKNWSVIYRDGVTPALAPAYDIVSTLQYAPSTNAALNMARTKSFYEIDEGVWRQFARHIGIAEKLALTVVRETIARARDAWPALWRDLTLPDVLRTTLRGHWAKLPAWYGWDAKLFD